MQTYIESGTGKQLTLQQIQSGNFPAGTFFIQLGGGGQQFTQQDLAPSKGGILPTPTGTAPVQSTSVSSGTGNAQTQGIPASLYQTMRQNIQSGQMTPQQAQATLQAYINGGAYAGSVDLGQLFAPMQVTQNGQQMALNADGTFKPIGATGTQTTVGPDGTTTAPIAGSAGSGNDAGASILSQIPSTLNSGDPNVDALYASIYANVKNNLQLGNIVNPNLQVTPALLSQLVNESVANESPQFQQALTDTITGVNATLSAQAQQYQATQGSDILNFQQGLQTERNTAAGAGTSFSSGNMLAQNQLAQGTNNQLAGLDASTALNIGNTLRTGAAAVGNNNLGLNGTTANFSTPTLNSATVGLNGLYGGSVGGNALNFNYNPSTYTNGSIVYGNGGYQSAVGSQTSQLLQSYLTGAGNNSTPAASANLS